MVQLDLSTIQKTQYEILLAVVDFCNRNQITYSLIGGTLLGSIRHNGYIPWDDDIDIVIPRDDYEKLKSLIRQGMFKHDFLRFVLPGDDGCVHPFIKVQDTRTILFDEKLEPEFKLCLNIDLFPLDHMPDNNLMHRICFTYNRILRTALATRISRGGIKKNALFVLVAKTVYCLYGGYRHLCSHIDNCARRMDRLFKNSKHVGNGSLPENMKDYYLADDIFPLDKHIFENQEFNIPHNYDAVLTGFYGDYMTPLAEGERARHDFTVYWR